MRLGGNGGAWQSRNDGAVYFRDFPAPLTVPGLDPDDNDVWVGGLALEAGLRRATHLHGIHLRDAEAGRGPDEFPRELPPPDAGSPFLPVPDDRDDRGPVHRHLLERPGHGVRPERRLRECRASRGVLFWTGVRLDEPQATAAGSVAAAPSAVVEPPVEAQLRDLDNRIRILDMGVRLQDLERRGGPGAPVDSLRISPLAAGAPDSSTTYQAALQQIRADYDSLASQARSGAGRCGDERRPRPSARRRLRLQPPARRRPRRLPPARLSLRRATPRPVPQRRERCRNARRTALRAEVESRRAGRRAATALEGEDPKTAARVPRRPARQLPPRLRSPGSPPAS